VVPPNWDSWGKIRVLREGFDVEQVSNGWTIDLGQSMIPPADNSDGEGDDENGEGRWPRELEGSAVTLFESAVQDPTKDALHIASRTNHSTRLEVETTETQAFLGEQLKVLEGYRQKSEQMHREEARGKNGKKEEEYAAYSAGLPPEPKVLEHIGPVQFNMGGIQVDADDMVQRLMVRTPSPPVRPVSRSYIILTAFPGPSGISSALRPLDPWGRKGGARTDGYREPAGFLHRAHE